MRRNRRYTSGVDSLNLDPTLITPRDEVIPFTSRPPEFVPKPEGGSMATPYVSPTVTVDATAYNTVLLAATRYRAYSDMAATLLHLQLKHNVPFERIRPLASAVEQLLTTPHDLGLDNILFQAVKQLDNAYNTGFEIENSLNFYAGACCESCAKGHACEGGFKAGSCLLPENNCNIYGNPCSHCRSTQCPGTCQNS